MGGPLAIPLQILIAMAVAVFGIYLLVKLLMVVGWGIGQVFRFLGEAVGRLGGFLGGEVSDALRLVGGLVTAALFVPLAVANVALGRWSRANHYGRSLEEEAVGVAKCVYRMALGHPARLLGVTHLTDGVERRLPEAIRRAPGPDLPRGRPDAFAGYTIKGSLPSGGSGARLYLAEPHEAKRTALAAQGLSLPPKVVIKSFSLGDGSTLPQIVRESRALHSARKLGLVLEHELTASRFHYVMPYVPGEDLTVVTQRLHAESPAAGLGDEQLRRVLGYMADLLAILERFHAEGLWHKDIKPSNIIVSEGRVKLVDLGLITPLASAMTLTTHGTEYFRDPELVRLALRGVKVNEVDGVKFDIYGAGAVFYSMLENSFPAHGSLSQLTKRCPESVRWIIRRAMADMAKRYGTAREMLTDLQAVIAAPDPSRFAPALLPSMGGPLPGDASVAAKARGFFARWSAGRGAADLADLDASADEALEREAAFERELAGGPAAGAAGAGAEQGARTRRRREEGGDAATKRSGPLRAGVLVAAGCFLLGLFGVASLLFMPRFEEMTAHKEWTRHEDHHATSGTAVIAPPPGAWPSTSRPAPVPARATGARHGQLRALATALAKHRSADVPTRVLVLDDAPVGLADTAERAMAPTLEGLQLARFEVVGWGVEHDLGEEEHARLEADARALLGLGNPGDPELAERLRAFLADEPALDGLLWLGRGADEHSLSLEFLGAAEQDEEDGRTILGLAARTL